MNFGCGGVPHWVALLFVAIGLLVLTWSANKFVDGALLIAREALP